MKSRSTTTDPSSGYAYWPCRNRIGSPTAARTRSTYGNAGAEDPVIRFDTHHGSHDLHIGARTYDIDVPGLEPLYQAWRAALPPSKRSHW
jgi:hypothetical protein